MTEVNGNGAGRFLRIENKLDKLVDDQAEFREDVVARLTAIETAALIAKELATTRWAQASNFWLKVGVYVALISGVGSMVTLLYIHAHTHHP